MRDTRIALISVLKERYNYEVNFTGEVVEITSPFKRCTRFEDWFDCDYSSVLRDELKAIRGEIRELLERELEGIYAFYSCDGTVYCTDCACKELFNENKLYMLQSLKTESLIDAQGNAFALETENTIQFEDDPNDYLETGSYCDLCRGWCVEPANGVEWIEEEEVLHPHFYKDANMPQSEYEALAVDVAKNVNLLAQYKANENITTESGVEYCVRFRKNSDRISTILTHRDVGTWRSTWELKQKGILKTLVFYCLKNRISFNAPRLYFLTEDGRITNYRSN